MKGSGGVAGLAAAAQVRFPHIEAARRLTERGLEQRAELLRGVEIDRTASLVLTGGGGDGWRGWQRLVERRSEMDALVKGSVVILLFMVVGVVAGVGRPSRRQRRLSL